VKSSAKLGASLCLVVWSFIFGRTFEGCGGIVGFLSAVAVAG
jgi:hypothetical protein